MKKKFNLLILSMIIAMLISFNVFAKEFATQNVQPDKVWTVKFTGAFDENSLLHNIVVTDSNNNVVKTTYSVSTDKKTISIKPVENYKVGQVYALTVNTNVKSAKGKVLKQPGTLKFTVINDTVNTSNGTNVKFNDKNLEKEIRKEIGKTYGDIEKKDIIKITQLELIGKEIKDISGIENFENLKTIRIDGNEISDISSLRNLKKLEELSAAYNKITNIEPISRLKNLTWVNLENNNIVDVKPLKDLNNLKTLLLKNNKINDYSAVSDYYNNLNGRDFKIKSIAHIDDINLTVSKGKKFVFPSMCTAKMSDGEMENVFIDWDNSKLDTSKEGEYSYTGIVSGYKDNVKLTVNVSQLEDIKTYFDLQNYLNKNYSILKTPACEYQFSFSIIEQNGRVSFPCDIEIDANWYGMSPYDLKRSESISNEDKQKTISLLKEFQQNIAKETSKYFPDKKVIGSFYFGYYNYPHLRLDYNSVRFMTWVNFNYDLYSSTYKSTYITNFQWFDKLDNYKDDDYKF